MDMNALKEAIDQGFKNLESGLVEKFREVRQEINGTKALIEHLRHDLKIFDEDSTPGSVIPLARRVTNLETRVKKLEES